MGGESLSWADKYDEIINVPRLVRHLPHIYYITLHLTRSVAYLALHQVYVMVSCQNSLNRAICTGI